MANAAQPPAASAAASVPSSPFAPRAGVQAAARTDTTPPATSSAPVQPAEPATPVELLKQRMDAMGISSSGLQFTESQTVVGYPGGSYLSHLITVDFGGGLQENYDVRLMMREPAITAIEIDRLRKSGGKPV